MKRMMAVVLSMALAGQQAIKQLTDLVQSRDQKIQQLRARIGHRFWVRSAFRLQCRYPTGH
jgi:hypothetical protein